MNNKPNNAVKWIGEDMTEEYDIVSEGFQSSNFCAVLPQRGRRSVENSSSTA